MCRYFVLRVSTMSRITAILSATLGPRTFLTLHVNIKCAINIYIAGHIGMAMPIHLLSYTRILTVDPLKD